MSSAVWIGTLAALCSMASFAPQAWKIMRTRDTRALSRRMYILTVAGFALWTTYGALIREWPLIGSNLVCFCLSGFILVMKLREGRDG